MPLNPEAIDYTNLYSPNSAIKTSSGSSIDEMVGITRAFNAIMKNLPPEMLSSFEKRYTEGYDLTDATPLDWDCPPGYLHDTTTPTATIWTRGEAP